MVRAAPRGRAREDLVVPDPIAGGAARAGLCVARSGLPGGPRGQQGGQNAGAAGESVGHPNLLASRRADMRCCQTIQAQRGEHSRFAGEGPCSSGGSAPSRQSLQIFLLDRLALHLGDLFQARPPSASGAARPWRCVETHGRRRALRCRAERRIALRALPDGRGATGASAYPRGSIRAAGQACRGPGSCRRGPGSRRGCCPASVEHATDLLEVDDHGLRRPQEDRAGDHRDVRALGDDVAGGQHVQPAVADGLDAVCADGGIQGAVDGLGLPSRLRRTAGRRGERARPRRRRRSRACRSGASARSDRVMVTARWSIAAASSSSA